MKRNLFLLYCLFPVLLFGQGILSTLEDMHSVVKGETWESIAASRGVSVDNLQAANPDVSPAKKLKKGTLLIIPRKVSAPQHESVIEVPAKPNPIIRTSVSDLKVGVLLPFTDKMMVEFYRGLLMAADSVRRSGANIDIHAWESGSTVAWLETLTDKFSDLDILFGPSSPAQIPVVAEVCKENGTRLVLPFWSGQALFDYPLVYNATSPGSVLFDAAVRKLMNFYGDRNYVVIQSGKTDSKGQTLTDAIRHHLAGQSVLVRTLALDGDDFAYESAFNQYHYNMLVLDDSSKPSLGTLLTRLKDFHEKHPQYRLTLVGYEDWLDSTAGLPDGLSSFDIYIISPTYYNMSDDRTRQFERSYAKNFRAYITKTNPRYAALGFDLGCYFLSGLSSQGDTFEQMQGSLWQEPYQNRFLFERNASGLSFFNTFVQFIHFSPDGRVELIR